MSETSLFKLIYISQACQPMGDDQLAALQRGAVAHNERVGITGVLLYGSGKILQLLEGPREELAALYGRIALDPRHVKCRIIFRSSAQARSAPSWSMGVANADRLGPSMSIETLESTINELATETIASDPAGAFVQAFERLMHGFAA